MFAHSLAKTMPLQIRLLAAIVVSVPTAVEAQGASCYAHSDCPGGQYCDTSMLCYSCTYINPSSCDAIDYDCCGWAFLQNCPSDPAGCGGGGGPAPPPGPGGGGGLPSKPGQAGVSEGTDDWAVYTLLVICLGGGVYLFGGAYYNVSQKGIKPGLEAIPNVRMHASSTLLHSLPSLRPPQAPVGCMGVRGGVTRGGGCLVPLRAAATGCALWVVVC
jgi:hypothetical protein